MHTDDPVDNQMAADYTYDAFGNQTKTNGDIYNPFRYNGEYYDDETGYTYLRNRYYDSEKGRFISQDPIKDGLNWYSYCGGNPVNMIDPSGLSDKRFVTTDGDPLNIRSGAGTSNKQIGSIANGSEVTFTGNKTGMIDGHSWAEVTTASGTTGWVAATYLACESPGTRAPMVFVGEHDVAGVGNHSNVIIYADPNSQLVKDNPNLFKNSVDRDGSTWNYGTLGAAERNGGPLGDLVADNNRGGDVGVVTGGSKNANMTQVSAGYDNVLTLISSDKYFINNSNDKIKYGATMTANSDRYNSNSYARGLLEVAGISAPSLDGWFPGWDKPIPKTYYGK